MISTKPTDQYRTPLDLFDQWNTAFDFTVDGAANNVDNLVPHWWGPGGGVKDFFNTTPNDWKDESVWINPPYSMVGDFLAHADNVGRGAPVVCWLLPVWTDRAWWHEFVWEGLHPRPHVHVNFLRGRVKFLNPDGSKPVSQGRFPSCLVTWYNSLRA